MNQDPKKNWPECVGKAGEQAKALILKDNPSLNVQIVQPGQVVTMDVRTDRVRIFINDKGVVDRPPRIN
jgi:hypothetical protein